MDGGHVNPAAEVSLCVRVEWFWKLKKKVGAGGLCRIGGKAY